MPENNSRYMNSVYIKAEELFEKVKVVQSDYLEWTALAHVDIEAYIETHFKGFQDWETNFKMLKEKRLELKKLPDNRKIDCVTINIVPFKGGVEDMFKKLSEALVETLRDSIEKDKDEVEQFVTHATNKLNINPKSIEEI
jgi:hypothetical protein